MGAINPQIAYVELRENEKKGAISDRNMQKEYLHMNFDEARLYQLLFEFMKTEITVIHKVRKQGLSVKVELMNPVLLIL